MNIVLLPVNQVKAYVQHMNKIIEQNAAYLTNKILLSSPKLIIIGIAYKMPAVQSGYEDRFKSVRSNVSRYGVSIDCSFVTFLQRIGLRSS